MDCKNIVDLLSDYVEGNLDPEMEKEITDHFEDCVECKDFLKQFKKTLEWTRDFFQDEIKIPDAVKNRLKNFVQQLEKGEKHSHH